MSHKKVHDALATRLVAIQTSGEPPIAGENFNYTPTEGELYLHEKVLRSGHDRLGVEYTSQDRHRGIYQVSVYAPAGEGRAEGETQADLVAAHFPKGGEYSSGGVTVKIRYPQVGGGFNSGSWRVIPVSIYWESIF